jgi:hypothetical protein
MKMVLNAGEWVKFFCLLTQLSINTLEGQPKEKENETWSLQILELFALF